MKTDEQIIDAADVLTTAANERLYRGNLKKFEDPPAAKTCDQIRTALQSLLKRRQPDAL